MYFEGMPWLPALPLWGTEGKAGGSVSLLCIVRPRRGLQVACTLFDQALFWRRAEHTRVYLRDRALGQGEARHQRGAASRGVPWKGAARPPCNSRLGALLPRLAEGLGRQRSSSRRWL